MIELGEIFWRKILYSALQSDWVRFFRIFFLVFLIAPLLFLGKEFGSDSILSDVCFEVDAWVELLKRLLLRHEQVRAVAMDCGLMETVIDMLIEMDSSISRDIHVHSRAVMKKKVCEPLRMCMELLMNLLFRNTRGKQQAAQRSLASVLISLWITIIHDTEALHILFLKLLCTFGARCQDALATFVKGRP